MKYAVMNDKDLLQRFLFENAPVRGEIVHLNHSYQTIIQQHQYPPAIQKLLGEALIAVSLLSAIIKFNGRLTIQFQGKGKIKLFLAQCDEQFCLRGLVQFQGELSSDEVWSDLKQGTLAIMMDPDIPGGKRYQGIVAWEGDSLAESIQNYFYQSEQLPTRLWIAQNENGASGLLLQVMPKDRPELYKNDWDHLIHLTNTVTSTELLTLDNSVLLHRLYAEEDVRLFQPVPVMFKCNCSTERSENAISLLGVEEAEAELKSKQQIVVTCEFCNTQYIFDRVDVARIFKKGNSSSSGNQLH